MNFAYQIVGVTDSFHLTLSSPVTWSGAGQTMSFTSSKSGLAIGLMVDELTFGRFCCILGNNW